MIRNLTIINNKNETTSISLSNPRESGLLITNIDGLDAPVGQVNMIERNLLNGDVFNGSRANGRNIVLTIRYHENNINLDSVEDIRHKVYKVFPIGEKITLIVTTDTREVYFEGYVETNVVNIFSQQEESQVSILCENSYGRGKSENTDSFSGIESAFEFPFSNESLSDALIEFGNLYTVYAKMVDSESEARTGFVTTISFKESVSGVIIANATTGQRMMLNGSYSNGDILEISTIQGDKYVKLNGDNALGSWYTNSSNEWVELMNGDNYISITNGAGQETMVNSIITIEYPVLYMGV